MPTILIVDDQPEVLQIYSRALHVAGYRVQIADSAEVALQLVEAEPPDAVLLDLKMPYINGMGLLYRLRKGHPRMPIAMMTGMSTLDTDSLQELAMLDTGVHFKPLTIAEIQKVADDLLGRK
jgi:DNA-binding response OmpR family regulator